LTDRAVSDGDDNETIGPLERPVETLQQLYRELLPTVSARIWETCCWPDRNARKRKKGEFRFVVLSIEPDERSSLYVQFWSEPGEPVLAEVCSGEASPGSLKYVQASQRRWLRSLAYQKGGDVNNFQKKVVIEDTDAAEAAAREALRILFKAFDYRGQVPLEITQGGGERAVSQPVRSSIEPEGFAKLLADNGFATTVSHAGGFPVVTVRLDERHLTVRFQHRSRRAKGYRAFALVAVIRPGEHIPDDKLMELTRETGIAIWSEPNHDIWLSATYPLDGGVTSDWVLRSLNYWLASVDQCALSIHATVRGSSNTVPPNVSIH
jgi:hypothetical protein